MRVAELAPRAVVAFDPRDSRVPPCEVNDAALGRRPPLESRINPLFRCEGFHFSCCRSQPSASSDLPSFGRPAPSVMLLLIRSRCPPRIHLVLGLFLPLDPKGRG
ncbi:hypothetical protein BHE74_00016000 [Ensete ventricosum]|nr:hypothetical protein BHE74_00016000 [Ensete ventricosum]